MIKKTLDMLGVEPKDQLILRAAIKNAVWLCLIAFTAVEVLIYFIYRGNGWEYLVREWVISGIIALVVSFPIAAYVCWQRAKLNELAFKLSHLARTDQMSGLLNRSSFFEHVEKKLRTPFAGVSSGSLLYIDADHFKDLNDHCGHATGDDAILEIAKIISQTSVEDAIAGRLGGEEFGLFLPKTNLKFAKSIAENLRRKVRKLVYQHGNYSQRLSISIGGALHTSGQSIGDLVQTADERMYIAKSTGRNRAVFEDTASPALSDVGKTTRTA